MVAAAVELVFIPRGAIRKWDGTCQTTFRQQLERAVDGGKADLGIFLAHQAKKFVGGEMVAGFQEGAQDGVTLIGVLEADTLEVPVKNLLRFAHGFARRWRVIVNSSLQHGSNRTKFCK